MQSIFMKDTVVSEEGEIYIVQVDSVLPVDVHVTKQFDDGEVAVKELIIFRVRVQELEKNGIGFVVLAVTANLEPGCMFSKLG